MATTEGRISRLEGAYEQVDARLSDLSAAINRLEARMSRMDATIEALRADFTSRTNTMLLLIGAFGTAILGASLANLFAG